MSIPVIRRYLTDEHTASNLCQSINAQLSTTKRFMLEVPSKIRLSLDSLFRYRNSRVWRVAGRTATDKGEPSAKETPVIADLPARKDSSLELEDKSIEVKFSLCKPVRFNSRRFLHLSTNNAFIVFWVALQLISSLRNATQLLRLSVPTIAWLTSVRSRPNIRDAP